jgi:tripartite-type tricarboxylate transporter receptor subunit TctC
MVRTWAPMPLAGLLLASQLACTANAQSYPTRPIKLIVAIAAGSVTDVIMRAAANELADKLGQPIVIENQGGASGVPAARSCAIAEPDGYTLCVMSHSTTSYNPLLFAKLPYNPEDIEPITRLFFLIEGIFVPAGLNANTVAELKELAQSKSSTLSYGTLGAGSFPELFLKWLNNQWNSNIVGIPYRGGGPIAQAVAANEVQVTRVGLGNFMGLIEAGKVKVLTVNSKQRSPLVPAVPTFAETGLDGYPGYGWWGLAAPKGTPPAIVERVNSAFVKLLQDPKFVAFLDKQAVVSAPTTPQGFAEFIKADREAARAVVEIANTRAVEYKPE